MSLIKQTFIGKYRPKSGSASSGNVSYSDHAQIYLHCGGEETDCHDSIAILPARNGHHDPNDIVDSITDDEANHVFAEHGWLVKGLDGSSVSRCPICRLAYETKQ